MILISMFEFEENCFRKVMRVLRVNIIYAKRVQWHRGIISSGVLLQFATWARTWGVYPRGMDTLLKLTIRMLPVSRNREYSTSIKSDDVFAWSRRVHGYTILPIHISFERLTDENFIHWIIIMEVIRRKTRNPINFSRGKICIGANVDKLL